MAVKECLGEIQPPQLYVVLIMTVLFFVTELVVSHITHSLTLLMDAYHMLCNIMALTGCIVTLKYGKDQGAPSGETTNQEETSKRSSTISEDLTNLNKVELSNAKKNRRANQEKRLKNTFGWARIDVLSMLICCIFVASLSFSVFVEALQTLIHIDHLDEMHHSISVLCIGASGLLLNAVCYLLIGGYTFHQGSFLYVTESGDVVLDKVVVPDVVKKGGRRLSRSRRIPFTSSRARQSFGEVYRDAVGCVFVIICAILVHFTDKEVAKFVDPIFALISAISLMFLSYPFMKESCLILLQTIPRSLNIDELTKDLFSQFPDIQNIHDFHVWQLTTTKIISTVHIIFRQQKGYAKLMDEIKEFLTDYGITQLTIQPEFEMDATVKEAATKTPLCLMACQGEDCQQSHCCPNLIQDSSKRNSNTLTSSTQSIAHLNSVEIAPPEEIVTQSQEITNEN